MHKEKEKIKSCFDIFVFTARMRTEMFSELKTPQREQ